jgi:hypothetical protein
MIASLREEAQAARRCLRSGKISFWERKLGVRPNKDCGKCGEAFLKPIHRRTNRKI